ncbi:MAG: hypothetical protein IPH44_10800 [Myxococcales bacterium]|nr:hypothetical protein [Myxococcales bacterium]MBK7195732.1 hypothetical protein [Myxococcales bacterium]MBP6848527.1 hypothetical protein [Kofleriaceae bacterium]
MKAAALLALALATGCGGAGAIKNPSGDPWPPAPLPRSLAERVVWDFEHATLAGPERWIELFDFTEVGAFEILLRRYDLLGRLTDLTDDEKAELAAEDGTPYPPERERRNVGRFYKLLAQRTVGTGGCAGAAPHWAYNRKLGEMFEPLPPGHEAYEPLRQRINAQLEGGGVIGIRCRGGAKGLALVYSPRRSARGYAIVTIYDDGP